MSDNLVWDTGINSEGQLTWENMCPCCPDKGASPLAQPTLGWESQLCSGGSLIPLGHVTDTLAGTGHALEAKPSCHPLVALQISNLTVNLLPLAASLPKR